MGKLSSTFAPTTMPRRYRPRWRSSYGSYRAAQHVSARASLSYQVGGIDKDIETAFLNLADAELERIFRKYGTIHGRSAEAYARVTHEKWKAGKVRMSGAVAERLINLVPPELDASLRFDLVKKLRSAFLHKENKAVTAEPENWRAAVAPLVAELLTASERFRLPQRVLDKVAWLAGGDTQAAQALLTAAEQDEAIVRLRYLEAEFRRIDTLIQTIEATRSVSHRIELPQGTISITIKLPEQGVWAWLQSTFG
jgi:hypothetical protein